MKNLVFFLTLSYLSLLAPCIADDPAGDGCDIINNRFRISDFPTTEVDTLAPGELLTHHNSAIDLLIRGDEGDYEEGNRILHALAIHEFPDSLYELYCSYMGGRFGVEQSNELALRYLSRAVEVGHIEAIKIAYGLNEKEAKIFKSYQDERLDEIHPLIRLAMYLAYRSDSYGLDRACEIFDRAIKESFAEAAYWASSVLINKNAEMAIKYIDQMPEDDDRRHMLYVFAYYWLPEHSEGRDEKVLFHLKKAAEAGNKGAKEALAKLLFYGKCGVKQDVAKGLADLEKYAKENNSKDAQYWLGKIYIEGREGVKQDIDKGLAYLESVIKYDENDPDDEAMVYLACLLIVGEHVDEDLGRAKSLLQQVAEEDEDNKKAKILLALLENRNDNS